MIFDFCVQKGLERSKCGSGWKAFVVVQVRSDGSLDQDDGGGGNGDKNPTGAPCSVQAQLSP